MCVECGGDATEGSMQHPYCKECFSKIWNNNYNKYYTWLKKTHKDNRQEIVLRKVRGKLEVKNGNSKHR